jgi:hypothetical protein
MMVCGLRKGWYWMIGFDNEDGEINPLELGILSMRKDSLANMFGSYCKIGHGEVMKQAIISDEGPW